MSETTTRGIRVEVESMYVEERSEPRENYYFFAYRVRISNVGTETAQLVSRVLEAARLRRRPHRRKG